MPTLKPVDSAGKQSALSPLALLRKVRDVLQQPHDAQMRLDKLVGIIAGGMRTDVCSLYLARSGDLFELFASQGLAAGSVHQTKLRVGEGLVGQIAAQAAALNLATAKDHPNFAYKKETQEEDFQSFLGVPILFSHKVIGVLVVQSREERIWSDEQAETLHTIAMVVAEMAVAGKIVNLKAIAQHKSNQSEYFAGLKLSPGLARAPAVLHRPKIEIKVLVSDDPVKEEKRLQKALVELQQSVDALMSNVEHVSDETQRDIMETYRMFSQDRGWLERISEAIRGGLTAEAAVRKVQEQMHAKLSQVSSQYIRERMQDLEDLSSRLLCHLAGISPTAAQGELPDEFIIVAHSLGPAELLEYAGPKLRGVVLEEGSASSHIDIPMVARMPGIAGMVEPGERIIVDGNNGEVYIRPPEDVEQAIEEHIRLQRERNEAYLAKSNEPAETLDGQRISLNLNIGLYLDAHQLERKDVDGIGLYRTELPYLASSDLPDVEEQKKMYGEIFRHSHGKRIVFRSFDIGGDKQVPYMQIDDEENPAMGWRATRIGLDRPVILRRQFRALIRAAAGQELSIMFPFIAEVSEFDATKELLERELERAKVEGYKLPKSLRVGSMVEIPSLLFQLPALLMRVDFVSIGSNDLLQFLFACDRNSQRMSGRYDPLSPIVMTILRSIVHESHKYNVEVGFCGDMATRPIEAMALLGCGMHNISVPPSALGPVKAMIRSVNFADLSQYVEYLCSLPDHSIRRHLEQYARDHGVELEG